MSPQLLLSRPSLAERVETVIRLRTGSQIRELHVEVSDGCVVLNGTSSSYYVKQLATHAAQSFGISLQNHIRVGE